MSAASGGSVTAESMTFLLIFHFCIWKLFFTRRKVRKTPKPTKTAAMLTERRSSGSAAGQGPGAGGRPQQPQTCQELLTCSRKQGGRWKGQGGELGKGSAMGSPKLSGVQKVQSLPIEKILLTMSPRINSPPSGFLLNRILLQFL